MASSLPPSLPLPLQTSLQTSKIFFLDSNKTISDVLTEFEEGGCLSQYDKNGVSHWVTESDLLQSGLDDGLFLSPPWWPGSSSSSLPTTNQSRLQSYSEQIVLRTIWRDNTLNWGSVWGCKINLKIVTWRPIYLIWAKIEILIFLLFGPSCESNLSHQRK